VHGARGWSYRELLPFFKRSKPTTGGASEWHGARGELGVSDLRNDHPYCEAWLAAGAEAGYPLTDDFNGARCDGLGRYQLTLRGPLALRRRDRVSRTRCGSAEPHSCDRVLVTRVVVEAGRATGIEWIDAGRQQGRARAEREVIVAAGALQSPQLLQLSGIGPAGCCAATASRRRRRAESAATCRTTTRRASSSS
jgi:choline dehydrogenase